MRWSGLAGCCALLLASNGLVACGDDDSNPPNTAGTDSGGSSSAGKSSGGSDKGGSSSTAGKGGSDAGGDSGGTEMGGTEAGGTGGSAMAGTGGTGEPPMCTNAAIDCPDDFNPCTTAACVDGKCVHQNNTEACTDDNPCTDDICDAGACKSTNNTKDCDDANVCTDADKCVAGKCTGTNNAINCDDLSSCTPGQDKCAAGVCSGTKDAVLCPACAGADNMIKNCDFSMMLESWATTIGFDGGVATQSVVNERDVVNVTQGGGNLYSVQPRQEPLMLKQGFRYKFGLVAGSNTPRDAAVALTQGIAPYKVHSPGDSDAGGFKVALVPQMKPFNFEFLMTDPDDAVAKLEIKVGGTAATPTAPATNQTYFDDVYLKEIKCTDDPSCSDGNPCTVDTCAPATGKCTWAPATDGEACDPDAESCTNDVCEAGVCKHNAKADDATCDNEASDTKNCTKDLCKVGKCTHPWDAVACKCEKDEDCNDTNSCTTDVCTVATGACGYTNNTLACDDANVCTNDDVCGAGTCGGANACYASCATDNLLLTNCDFATDATGWTLYTGNGAGATQLVKDGALAVTVANAGTNDYDIQVLQGDVVLAPNRIYRVKLNAHATSARKIFVGLTQNGGWLHQLRRPGIRRDRGHGPNHV
jgi:hypothetical protein